MKFALKGDLLQCVCLYMLGAFFCGLNSLFLGSVQCLKWNIGG